MEILETKGRKMNKIKREERENLHTFSDTTDKSAPTSAECSLILRTEQCNGFCSRRWYSHGFEFSLRIPCSLSGNFYPVLLA